MSGLTTENHGAELVVSAAGAALRQAFLLASECPPGEALRRIQSLREAAQKVADCFEPGSEPAVRSERDAQDLAKARARILLNKIMLVEAARRARAERHQKSGSTA